MAISFQARVALVTGAGGGLGRAYARELGRRGAHVVVNDLSPDAADAVVAEIEAEGGSALAAAASVADAEALASVVEAAEVRWGGVHILINNAGLLRDRTFAKMTADEWETVLSIHLGGAFNATRAVWETMRAQGYGRILMTTSSNGLYGAFGQANYSAAKMALVGLMKTLSLEGAKNDVRVNAIAPIAGTSMTADGMSLELFARFTPEKVAAAALYLVSDDAPTNVILSAGGGVVHAARVTQTPGVLLGEDDLSPEGVARRWAEIVDPAGEVAPPSGDHQIRSVFERVKAAQVGSSSGS